MVNKIYHIYSIVKGGRVVYIGVSSNPSQRLKSHKSAIGTGIEMKILEIITDKRSAFKRESELIEEYRQNGLCELNGQNITGNVRISVSVMERVRKYCDENRVLLGGFFEMGAEKLLNELKPVTDGK